MNDGLDYLIARVAMKDRDAFSELYRLTSPKLFGICLRLMKRRMDAEDALQEIFMKIWHRAGQFSGVNASAMAWLCAIARYHCIDLIRLHAPVSTPLDVAMDQADTSHDPEQIAINSSEGRRIDRCMEALEAKRAKAVRQAYVEGLSYQELASAFDVPLNTMRTWLRRSLLTLRECLDR
ncbi:sigma-70 family RNA polymerase sigma factor [Allorhizobium sp. BGMRC 0089]|uniref:sigma-70 family RNA polymerase sigma factor n=1 Tax=Allorhizobium sonneratiae TaxID=2934936 RepID=UPI0020338C99|nr:sigma-70 family RNA polymerase sigma factor [Allorhizobium sonneratiae]MCM2291499.1 sigma-70 family RNA polymerase sigma factor [Allorhizobium sonneratiae]